MGWKRNPWLHHYQWIKYLDELGYSLEMKLEAFEKNPATKMNRDIPEEVEFAKVLIKDALGQLPPSEIDKYILPSEVLGFSPAFEVSEGYVFNAHTPEDEPDFLFLVAHDAFPNAKNIDDVMKSLASVSSTVNQLVLQRYHTRHPYGLSGTQEVARAKISAAD
ncbi:hypothetical protein [Pantoea sp. PNT03]|uniref:hypothetical protein n=1 Tax=Pantoea sp. PNT03 TaxID=2769258 RepID=UPI001784F008|nr:hypothetical protein [Pantoea sp. PNT03]MBD9658103.1 hypothetical protein [Pantoea sp. PNT03]